MKLLYLSKYNIFIYYNIDRIFFFLKTRKKKEKKKEDTKQLFSRLLVLCFVFSFCFCFVFKKKKKRRKKTRKNTLFTVAKTTVSAAILCLAVCVDNVIKQGWHVWRKCQICHELTVLCSSSIKSGPGGTQIRRKERKKKKDPFCTKEQPNQDCS